MDDIFTVTAILKDEQYCHINRNAKVLNACGIKGDIVYITFKIAENQTINKDSYPDYWGWFDLERQKFTHIWPTHLQLNMCFDNAMYIYEQRGRGKAYRLNIVDIKQN